MNHIKTKQRQTHPRDKANILSKLTFFYTLQIFRKGLKQDFKEKDLFEVPRQYESKRITHDLETIWKKSKSYSLYGLLWRSYGFYFIGLGLLRVTFEGLVLMINPYAIGKLVSYFAPRQNHISKNEAFLFAATIIVLDLAQSFVSHNTDLLRNGLEIKARAAFSSFIYRKILKMTVAKIAIGKIVTIITKDTSAFEYFVENANELWISLVKLVIIFIILFRRIGLAAIVGNAIFWFIIPFQSMTNQCKITELFHFLFLNLILVFLGVKVANYKLEMCKRSDVRYQIIQEVLSSIKIIKMQTWEKFLQKKIEKSRKLEILARHKIFYMQFVAIILGGLNVNIAFYILLMTYKQHNDITPEIVYFIMACFRTLLQSLRIQFPLGVSYSAQLIASITRINSVINTGDIKIQPTHSPSILPKINLNHVTYMKIFNNCNLELSKGLTIVTGAMSSGKSSLIKLILGEITPDTGYVKITGAISYASQEPWLFPSTIRQNILFGEEYHQERYHHVLHICALDFDLNVLPDGDQTIVQNRGVNLSKGQQARINLARAIYKQSDIYLLDDCLAALDNQVSCFIFQQCISNFLCNKLVLLVTHNLKICQNCNVITIKDGNIFYCEAIEKIQIAKAIENENTIRAPEIQHKTEKMLYVEEQEERGVKFDIYKYYIKQGGGFSSVFVIILCYIMAQMAISYTDQLVSSWVNLEYQITNLTHYNETNLEIVVLKRDRIYIMYGVFVVLSTILCFIRVGILFNFLRKASIRLHRKITESLMYAPMQFFDVNFIGNILNRFSRDFLAIDMILPISILVFLLIVSNLFGILALIIWVDIYFLIPAAVLFIILVIVPKYYLKIATSLRRLDSSTKSPMVGYINCTLEGLTTIRSCKVQNKLMEEFDRHQDLYTSATYTLQCCMKAFNFALDLLCIIFITVIILKLLIFDFGKTMPGNVGLAISQALMVTGILQVAIGSWANIEIEMTSVERILQYIQIKQENCGGLHVENWPQRGHIIYKNVSLRYPECSEATLKNLSFEIKSGEIVGIVGRTGAGKSSIIATLFRLYPIEGVIEIDGVNIKTLALHFVRSKISIIPQDSIVFTGTIRDNLDPSRKCSDEQIWEILENVGLKSTISNLEEEVCDDGIRFSAGQKQLICLARAIVCRNKIVILDEATSALDSEISDKIHQTIQKYFEKATVIIIAHNLKTILKCDKVLILERGEIVEFGDIQTLLANCEGKFYELVESVGINI